MIGFPEFSGTSVWSAFVPSAVVRGQVTGDRHLGQVFTNSLCGPGWVSYLPATSSWLFHSLYSSSHNMLGPTSHGKLVPTGSPRPLGLTECSQTKTRFAATALLHKLTCGPGFRVRRTELQGFCCCFWWVLCTSLCLFSEQAPISWSTAQMPAVARSGLG